MEHMLSLRYFTVVSVLFVSLNAVCQEPEKNQDKDAVGSITLKYNAITPTKTNKVQQYETELYQQLKAHAPAGLTVNLQAVDLATSTYRTRFELTQGEKINVMLSPHFVDNKYQALIVPIPVLQGLLGYRKIISRKMLQSRMAEIQVIEDLRKFKAGQVKGWEDIHVYQHNKFLVETSVDIDALFRMLASERFDFLPLGVIEIEQEFDKYKHTYSNIYIDESFMIYYPIPLLFHVNTQEPKIAEFLKYSMEKIIKNGVQDQLIRKHFSKAIHVIDQNNTPLFVLQNSSPLHVEEKYSYELLNPKH